MLKNKSKIIVLLIAFIMLISTISFATEGTSAGENARTPEGDVAPTSEEQPTTEQAITETEIYSGDLYLFDNNVVMDKLVDGNVFLFGKNIEITGRVNGSLFVFGDKVTFGAKSYVVQSIYACANELTLNGAANDLYAVASKIDMNYDSFMIRDLRVMAEEFNFKGGVGRDAFVRADNFTFDKTDGASAIVYGNLDYVSNQELELSKELVQGDIKYSKYVENAPESPTVLQIVLDKTINFVNTLILTFVIFYLIMWLAPKFAEKCTEYVGVKSFLSLGIGALAALLVIAFCIGLFFLCIFTNLGTPVLLSVFGIFALLMFISFTITVTCITLKLKEVFKLSKYITPIVLTLVSLILWVLQLIPYVGGLVSIFVTLVGFGTILVYLYTRTKKDKVEEVKK